MENERDESRPSQIIFQRAGIDKQDGNTFLLVSLGETYVSWLRQWSLDEPRISFYTFAYLFEYSLISGESGVHKFITDLTIGSPVGNGVSRYYPCSARLAIKLRAYDALRDKVSGSKKDPYGQPAHFPPYTKIGLGELG